MIDRKSTAQHSPESTTAQEGAEELLSVLCIAVRETTYRLNAMASVVYLLSEDRSELRAAVIGGDVPAAFMIPERMTKNAPYASARAVQTGTVVVPSAPESAEVDPSYISLSPFTVVSAPVMTDRDCFGSLTAIRLESGEYEAAERAQLKKISGDLARDIASLELHGIKIEPSQIPVAIPIVGETSAVGPTRNQLSRGMPGVPGSASMSYMYQLRHFSDLLNRATNMGDVMNAVQSCLMSTFDARSLILASVAEHRLWVVGHAGATDQMVKELHGSKAHGHASIAQALLGHPQFLRGDIDRPGHQKGVTEPASAYLPLIGSQHVMGTCCIEFASAGRLSVAEKAVLMMMTGLLGPTVERIEQNKNRKALAESLQRSLLPHMLSDLPRLTTAARYLASAVTAEVGGDWYDVIRLPNERIVLVVGDVEGHAIDSAVTMAQVRSAVVAYAIEGHHPSAILDRTSRLLAELGTELLATCCIVLCNTADGVSEVCLAGHPAPLVSSPGEPIRLLHAPPNVPLGITNPLPYRAQEHVLPPQSVLMLYSDGLTDAETTDPITSARALLGSGRRTAGISLEALADHILVQVSQPHERRDDAVLLLARYEGVGPVENMPRTCEFHIHRHDLRGVNLARQFVDERLRCWGLADLSDDLQLIVSEITTNSLIHAGSNVHLRLRAFPDHIRLEVSDTSSNPPIPSGFSLTEEGRAQTEHGRGLVIVDALARTWNTYPNGRGKTVWIELDIPQTHRT